MVVKTMRTEKLVIGKPMEIVELDFLDKHLNKALACKRHLRHVQQVLPTSQLASVLEFHQQTIHHEL
ncbi:hypothetical protein SDJN02_11898, partial [Cucurbita argyrosperma subsp. argyrosperma]